MSRLAAEGHNVLFIDPPINTGRVFLKQIQKGLWGLTRIISQVHKDPTKAVIYTPLNIVPSPEVTSSLHVGRIRKLARKYLDKKLRTVLWVYHVQIPYLERYIKNIEHDILVYDCVDNYAGFPQNSSFYSSVVPKNKVLEQEKFVSEQAELVFASAPGLVEKLKQYNDKVYFTPNVGDYLKFSKTSEFKDNLPADLEKIPRPRIGFTGALDEYKFDAELVGKAAQDHPDYSFILIGQMALKDREAGLHDLGLSGLKNVYFLGHKPYQTVEKYFAGFDVYIIPYQLNDYTVGGCFPVKFHDALSAGLPTVVTNLPAYRPFADVAYISETYDDFSANIKKAVEEDNEAKVNARTEVASKNTWEGKVETMLRYIRSVKRN